MVNLPPTRRIVTGHDARGHAIIESDTLLEPKPMKFSAEIEKVLKEKAEERAAAGKPVTLPDSDFTLLWRSSGYPAEVQGPWEEHNGETITLSHAVGTTLRIVDLGPNMTGPLHRTVSLDYGIVLKGEVVLELDDGVCTVMKAGDVVVQRGTFHAWHNRTAEPARIAFILMPSKKVKVEETGEELDTAPHLGL